MSLFKQHILDGGVLDPIGTHHEFAYGWHGRKIDFDLIPTNSSLYGEWVAASAQTIRQHYVNLPGAVVGVANGTNRLAIDVARSLGIRALLTEKATSRTVRLTADSAQELKPLGDQLIIILEDVGTSGGTALSAAKDVIAHGITRVEIQFSWQRSANLTAFKGSMVHYHAIIAEPLSSYTPEECCKHGYCAENWRLVRR